MYPSELLEQRVNIQHESHTINRLNFLLKLSQITDWVTKAQEKKVNVGQLMKKAIEDSLDSLRDGQSVEFAFGAESGLHFLVIFEHLLFSTLQDLSKSRPELMHDSWYLINPATANSWIKLNRFVYPRRGEMLSQHEYRHHEPYADFGFKSVITVIVQKKGEKISIEGSCSCWSNMSIPRANARLAIRSLRSPVFKSQGQPLSDIEQLKQFGVPTDFEPTIEEMIDILKKMAAVSAINI